MAKHDIKSSPQGAAQFLSPNVALLVKIGSALVHFDEYTSSRGHEYDLHTAKQLLADPDVAAWIKAGTASALLPAKRS